MREKSEKKTRLRGVRRHAGGQRRGGRYPPNRELNGFNATSLARRLPSARGGGFNRSAHSAVPNWRLGGLEAWIGRGKGRRRRQRSKERRFVIMRGGYWEGLWEPLGLILGSWGPLGQLRGDPWCYEGRFRDPGELLLGDIFGICWWSFVALWDSLGLSLGSRREVWR